MLINDIPHYLLKVLSPHGQRHGHQDQLLGLGHQVCLCIASASQCHADRFDSSHDLLMPSCNAHGHVGGQQAQLLGIGPLTQAHSLLKQQFDASEGQHIQLIPQMNSSVSLLRATA